MRKRKQIKKIRVNPSVFKKELSNLVSSINKPELADMFLHDILTPTEYTDLALRWQIVKLLKKGMSLRDVAYSLGVALATVERGSKELRYSTKKGFQSLLKNYV